MKFDMKIMNVLLLTDRESVCQEVACNDIEGSLDWGTFQF